MVEDLLFRKKIPISEFAVQSYVRDALFRNDQDIPHIINRIVPPVIHLEEGEWDFLADYISDALDEFHGTYTLFTDQGMGPIRQRVGELHTAVIDLSARLGKGDIDSSWLPKHTFIVLSQIQAHAAGLLEDLDTDEPPPETDLEAMDNTLDSMVETYEDIKELIGEALDSFRRNNLSVVRPSRTGDSGENAWRTVQISVGGIDVWRRAAVPESCRLEELHRIIQIILDWEDSFMHRFSIEMSDGMPGRKTLDGKLRIGDLAAQGTAEVAYEYGTKWTVRLIILSRYEAGPGEAIRCVAGAGAPPPELVEGPLRFRKILAALEKGVDSEKQAARHEVGADYDPGLFDMERYNRDLSARYPVKKPGLGPVRKDI
jgi:hypothetical protein